MEDKPRAIAEIFRVLKADGRLGLNCADADHPHEAYHFMRCAVTEAGVELDHLIRRPAVGPGHELEAIVTSGGFVAYEGQLRTFVNFYPDVDALLASFSSSSFGNFLVNVSEVGRARICDAFDRLLEPKRLAGKGIRLERYLAFATARKPKVD